jgi:hypothetical protein
MGPFTGGQNMGPFNGGSNMGPFNGAQNMGPFANSNNMDNDSDWGFHSTNKNKTSNKANATTDGKFAGVSGKVAGWTLEAKKLDARAYPKDSEEILVGQPAKRQAVTNPETQYLRTGSIMILSQKFKK